ncbi:DUF4382 domain-containing protein [Ferruginibacter profundus]
MKSTTSRLWVAGIVMLTLSLFFYSCQKETSDSGGNIPPGSTKYSIYLTDGPTDYQKVLIDIKSIAIKIDTCHRNHDDDHNFPGCDDDHDQINNHCEIWDTLSIRPGVYDLLTLRNGLDTLLATGFVLNGKVERIKFTLGDSNSVMVDSIYHPLQLVANQHYVFVNVGREHLDSISSNNFQLFLDFNISRSIWYVGGKYWLKPFLKPFGRHSSGEIEGKVRPSHSFGLIKAYNATDTAYAWPWSEGEFKIRGLKEGTYSLFIDGINGYQDSTITNISVLRNKETDVNTIVLHK